MSDSKIHYAELGLGDITPDHIAEINHLLPQLTNKDVQVTESSLKQMFEAGTRLFVAMDDDLIIATVVLSLMVILTSQKDWIEDVVTDIAYRGHGISSHLLDMAEFVARERSSSSTNLTSNSARVAARAMYTRRGYEIRDTDVFRKRFR